MTNREQLLREIERASDDVAQKMLDFLNRLQATSENHPLAKFSGILNDSEAEELQRTIKKDCRQVNINEW